MDVEFPPRRQDALARLADFVPIAGRDYAAQRNYDRPGHPHVSCLSPYLRHRIITEEEVLRAVLQRHSAQAAEKFIQEVFWRTYWKGWLEMRPGVWRAYQTELMAAWNRVQTESGLRRDWEAACLGQTGIDGFDGWAQELTRTGYLHNHARMWFASIWIFTLRLPWVLGADFFLRSLLDGDPASNTLSWRWVAGLQTKGKTYQATASNISKYTDFRVRPLYQLANDAPALEGAPDPDRTPIRAAAGRLPEGPFRLLITEDDMGPSAGLLGQTRPVDVVFASTSHRLSPLEISAQAKSFRAGLADDFLAREAAELGQISRVTPDALSDHLSKAPEVPLVTSYAPVGPNADLLAGLRRQGIPVIELRRDYDTQAWPHATAGFFKFKKKIPELLRALIPSAQMDLPGLAGGRL